MTLRENVYIPQVIFVQVKNNGSPKDTWSVIPESAHDIAYVRRKRIWHDASKELPDESADKEILFVDKKGYHYSGRYFNGVFDLGWDDSCMTWGSEDVVKWCILSDLLALSV